MTTIFQDSGGPDGVPEYRYEPLVADDAVRVLVVHPADRLDDPLLCSIVQYTHSAELSSDNYFYDRHYSAVSYTWGSDLLSHQLLIVESLVSETIGATLACQSLKITANVDSLLRQLRRPHKAVHLWIDAVCINQKDEDEKAYQVSRMGDIYTAAKKVHIWLGNDSIDDARRAFSVIKQAELRNEWEPSRDEVSLLNKFFRRAWFSRRWIIQEAVLAHEARLHCGPCSLSLSWVLPALKKAQSSATGLDALGYGAKMLLSSIGKYRDAPGDCSLLTLLWDLHLSECSDPRDRIAALYSLASGTKRPPSFRYHRATELYVDCAAYFINRDAISARTLILHLAEFGSLPEDSQRRQPLSWVPDWSRSRRPLLDFYSGFQYGLKELHGSMLSQGPPILVPEMFLPDHCSALGDYYNAFNHATRMHVQKDPDILRIHSSPLVFPILGGIVEKVYCCESSDWEDVWSLFRCMAWDLRENKAHTNPDTLLVMLIAASKKYGRGKDLRLSNLKPLVSLSHQSRGPSKDCIEVLEEIGFILSRYSIIQIKRILSTALENSTFRHSLVYHLAPRSAAVDDFLVPFMIPGGARDSYSFEPEDYWSVSMCLRPTLSAGMEIPAEKCHPLTRFCRTVRWIGLAFSNQGFHFLHFFHDRESTSFGYQAYWRSMENGLPGPFVFDVI